MQYCYNSINKTLHINACETKNMHRVLEQEEYKGLKTDGTNTMLSLLP